MSSVLNPDPALRLALIEPRIPQNTGAIGRLCVCTQVELHLVHPLGFKLTDRWIQRAGLDYWPQLALVEHPSTTAFLEYVEASRCHAFTTKVSTHWNPGLVKPGDMLVLGSEDHGFPHELRAVLAERMVRLPMAPGQRSLNLAVTAGIVTYLALAAHQYPGLE